MSIAKQIQLVGLVAVLLYSSILLLVHFQGLTLFDENSSLRATFDLFRGQSLVASVMGVGFASFLLTAKTVGFSLMILVGSITLAISRRLDESERQKFKDLGQPIVFSAFFFMLLWMSQEPIGLCLSRSWFSDCGPTTHMFRFGVNVVMIGLLVWATPSLVAALVSRRK